MRLPDNINIRFGNLDKLSTQTDVPFSEIAIDFLDSLSKDIFKNCPKEYTDVISFAFFCRKANLTALKKTFCDSYVRLGRGVVFHIAPSNVPVNFAFSYVFSLLSGNFTNIVRIPTKDFPQVDIILKSFQNIRERNEYEKIIIGTLFVQYERNKEINDFFSKNCAARIIWGGDATIKEIRKSEIPARAVDVAFADRFSFSVLDTKTLEIADDLEIEKLAKNFYNDTYFIDQNACSSPHLLVFKKGANDLKAAKERFFKALSVLAEKKYDLQSINAIDKLTKAYSLAISHDIMINKSNNSLYRLELKELIQGIECLREKCGFFFEYDCNSFDEITHIINTKYQTITYYGNVVKEIKNWVTDSRLSGIDRIVPVGEALNIGLIWDGYNLISELSRIVL